MSATEAVKQSEWEIYRGSLEQSDGLALFLGKRGDEKLLGVQGDLAKARTAGFEGEQTADDLLACPRTHANAVALRHAVSWLQPRPLGLMTSAGVGDRLGLATPGHIHAARKALAGAPGAELGMIFAQQSIREMTRTGRSPDDVMDDATWGIFQEGWRDGVGADADHLKNTEDIDRCLAAGFTFFTIDPGAHVDPEADSAPAEILRERFAALPWQSLDATGEAMLSAYAGRRWDLEGRVLSIDPESLVRAAVKYGRAVAHTAAMYRHLAEHAAEGSWELEVSVDETDTPTTHAEHLFIATELKRLGVHWVSLAPRYVGRFEKGVDYIGDLDAFSKDFAGHAEIARVLGPYKLSLHSGSDKFSIYGIAAEHTHGLLHLKTAGTSYLEALRTLATVDTGLFREILGFAIERYETDKASYHVSAQLAKVPVPDSLSDRELPELLEQFDSREVLHVTFGSVLTSERGYRARLMTALRKHEAVYAATLERHFLRHLQPLLAFE